MITAKEATTLTRAARDLAERAEKTITIPKIMRSIEELVKSAGTCSAIDVPEEFKKLSNDGRDYVQKELERLGFIVGKRLISWR